MTNGKVIEQFASTITFQFMNILSYQFYRLIQQYLTHCYCIILMLIYVINSLETFLILHLGAKRIDSVLSFLDFRDEDLLYCQHTSHIPQGNLLLTSCQCHEGLCTKKQDRNHWYKKGYESEWLLVSGYFFKTLDDQGFKHVTKGLVPQLGI